jgi:hypothetical protein
MVDGDLRVACPACSRFDEGWRTGGLCVVAGAHGTVGGAAADRATASGEREDEEKDGAEGSHDATVEHVTCHAQRRGSWWGGAAGVCAIVGHHGTCGSHAGEGRGGPVCSAGSNEARGPGRLRAVWCRAPARGDSFRAVRPDGARPVRPVRAVWCPERPRNRSPRAVGCR